MTGTKKDATRIASFLVPLRVIRERTYMAVEGVVLHAGKVPYAIMSAMEVTDIQHLASLARIALTEKEAADLAAEFEVILHYVAQVTEVSAGVVSAPSVGVHANVLREDIETHEPGVYTETLLSAASQRDGVYIQVKKIFKGKQQKHNDS